MKRGTGEWGKKLPLTIGDSGRDWLTGERGAVVDCPHHVATVAMGANEGTSSSFPHQALQLLQGSHKTNGHQHKCAHTQTQTQTHTQ